MQVVGVVLETVFAVLNWYVNYIYTQRWTEGGVSKKIF